MTQKILKIFILTSVLAIFSCAKKVEDPLILPPNFAEMPDPNKPEQPTEGKDPNVARLKELLLESGE